MKTVSVPKTHGDTLEAQLLALYECLKSSNGEQIEFTLDDSQKTYPLLALPLAALVHKLDRGSIVPMTILQKENESEWEQLATNFENILIEKLGNIPGTHNAIHYPIAELVTNIFEHSKENVGFLFAHYNQDKEYLDLCIVDSGRGLVKAYQEEQNLELSDADAIREVLKGHSTKSNVERGYGVRTSKRVVCEGLGGSFVLLSGSSALYAEKNADRLIELPDFYWQGVIVAYRVPKPKGPIGIAKYLE